MSDKYFIINIRAYLDKDEPTYIGEESLGQEHWKNFLFHDTEDGAKASSIVMSLIETAKLNQLNVFQYLYVLLLYMPDYKNEPAGIEQLLPWSDFIKEKCSGVMDTENLTPKTKGRLSI